MKAVYRADARTHIFVSSDLVPDDYVLKVNESFENPTGKETPAKLSGTTWLDATQQEHDAYMAEMQEEYLRQHPEANQPAEPDKGDQALNILGQQIAQMQASQVKMQQQQAIMMQSVNALGQMVAKAQAPAQPTAPTQPSDSQSVAQDTTAQA